MKKKNYLFLIIVLAITSTLFSYFYANYHGVCVIEGRKLSHDELLQRSMYKYFLWLKEAEYSLNEENTIWRKYCYNNHSDINKRCFVRILPSQNVADYIKSQNKNSYSFKNLYLKRIKENDDLHFSELKELFKKMKNHQSYSFSFYVFLSDNKDYRGDRFYPNNCCQVDDLNYFLNNGFSQEVAPPFYWRIFGWGNYFLTTKNLDFNGKYSDYSQQTLILNNCGNFTEKNFTKFEIQEKQPYIIGSIGYVLTSARDDDKLKGCFIFNEAQTPKHQFLRLNRIDEYIPNYLIWRNHEVFVCNIKEPIYE